MKLLSVHWMTWVFNKRVTYREKSSQLLCGICSRALHTRIMQVSGLGFQEISRLDNGTSGHGTVHLGQATIDRATTMCSAGRTLALSCAATTSFPYGRLATSWVTQETPSSVEFSVIIFGFLPFCNIYSTTNPSRSDRHSRLFACWEAQ